MNTATCQTPLLRWKVRRNPLPVISPSTTDVGWTYTRPVARVIQKNVFTGLTRSLKSQLSRG